MYGLVNIAIRDLILGQHGEETWDRIRERAGVRSTTFVAMETYPDEVTYGLVAAASEELGAPQEALLEAFGEYWMTFTAEEGYGDTLEFAGSTLDEFLAHLDDMHARVALTFPDLCPPSFEAEYAPDGRLAVRYRSDRPGLAPMVVGLLHGLARRFDKHIDIERVPSQVEVGADETFLLRISDASGAQAA
ncbi:MAG: heme NO-binding domain-containing protein [Planctomycetota bacterium]